VLPGRRNHRNGQVMVREVKGMQRTEYMPADSGTSHEVSGALVFQAGQSASLFHMPIPGNDGTVLEVLCQLAHE